MSELLEVGSQKQVALFAIPSLSDQSSGNSKPISWEANKKKLPVLSNFGCLVEPSLIGSIGATGGKCSFSEKPLIFLLFSFWHLNRTHPAASQQPPLWAQRGLIRATWQAACRVPATLSYFQTRVWTHMNHVRNRADILTQTYPSFLAKMKPSESSSDSRLIPLPSSLRHT